MTDDIEKSSTQGAVTAVLPSNNARGNGPAESVSEWLVEKARSYSRDADQLQVMPDLDDGTGLDGEQWAIVYRTVATELRKCAREAAP